MTWLESIFAIACGFLAGIINTLAGNGSAITLTFLLEVLNLPANIANATNRIGIGAQGIASFYAYSKQKEHWSNSLPVILPIFIGAMLGLWAALTVDNEQFRFIFGWLMVVMLVLTLINPEKWMREHAETAKPNFWLWLPAFLALGFYGGFIQMGMGIFFLAITVLGANYSLKKANVLKNAAATLYTLVAIAVFSHQNLVNWKIGITLAIGQFAGGWLAAKFATQHPKANVWTYWLLLAVIIFAIVKIFIF